MRIWSLHPKHLDAKGLVALWRETLLAQHVLEAKTKGYKNHPQLNRFKAAKNPVDAINYYLSEVYFEAEKRGYAFNREKINWNFIPSTINVTKGQIDYEAKHLLSKLKQRDTKKFSEVSKVKKMEHHPMFKVIKGDVEDWEIITG
ncbi:MAG TPA: pyrimidine dimer DNA glycosylase/endonuclease V [Chitinophagaceae bacterium]|nr:pyrimidine dimer DNA glycosylase/endonuclease V [Chitinophagaceae bacterium]